MTTKTRSKFNFSELVLNWFDESGRKDLPWQINPTPYRVWISEIMLQQTQVNTATPYYLRFMDSFPDIYSLSSASTDRVMHHWSGLGYYARARNLHKTSKIVQEEYNGMIPLDFDRLVELPGIGKSTAGAILSLSDNQRQPILDGNVKRVLARFHAIEGWPGIKKIENKLWHFAEQHLPKKRMADYTQAMMDLGATICTRSKPNCMDCPLKKKCEAKHMNQQDQFPTRKPAKVKPHHRLNLVLLRKKNKILLEKRPDYGIWGGLSSLPELKNNSPIDGWIKKRLETAPETISEMNPVRHAFSHYTMDICPVEVRIDSSSCKLDLNENEFWYELNHPEEVGMASPVKKLLEQVR